MKSSKYLGKVQVQVLFSISENNNPNGMPFTMLIAQHEVHEAMIADAPISGLHHRGRGGYTALDMSRNPGAVQGSLQRPTRRLPHHHYNYRSPTIW